MSESPLRIRRRALLASLSPLAFADFAGLVALALDPETTACLAMQLGQLALDTGRGVALYFGRATPLSTALFAALAWVAAGGFRAFVVHRDPSDTRATAEHVFALVASAAVLLVAIFARDQLVVVAGVGVVLLAGAGAVLAGRSNARGVVTGSLYTVAPVVGGGAVAPLATGPAVARTTTPMLPLTVGYVLGVAGVHGRLRLSAAVSALAFAAPAWMYFPPAVEAAGFDPEIVGLTFGFAVAAVLLSLPFAAIGYATTHIVDAERQAGVSPVASAVER